LKTKCFAVVSFLLVLFLLAGCSQNSSVQSMTVEQPTAVVAGPIPGVDTYVYYDGMNMQVKSAYYLDSITMNGEKQYAPSGKKLLAVDFNATGNFSNIANWSNEADINKTMRVYDNLGSTDPWLYNTAEPSANLLSYLFVVPDGASTYLLAFPDGTTVVLNLLK
jgi:hypothetical protein